MEREFSDLVAALVEAVETSAAPIRAAREAAPPLDADSHRVMQDAYAAELRRQGWLTEVGPERVHDLLVVVVMTGDDGAPALDIDSNVTESVWSVPGWGVTERDPAVVGRTLAEDEAELLDAMRDAGELTGWE